MKKSLIYILSIFLILKITALNSGCANSIPPTGGPKDSLPPMLVKADPPDSSKGFKDKTISLTFNEYILDIQQQNLQENLIVSPTPAIPPLITSKLKTITIKIKDTLEANTTYVYNFGKSIKDVNEGNELKRFSYIFTTGNYFDSLELTGKVLLAETGTVDSTLIVMLHRNGNDSALVNDNPRYITKLDSSGSFHFRHLPGGTYYIYALKDESGVHKYFEESQLFAFADQPVEIKPGASPVTLYAFARKKETPAVSVSLPATRATANRADENKLKFTTSINNKQHDLLAPLALSFEQPLKNFDSTKVMLSTDSAFTPLRNYSWQADSLNKKITLNLSWKENTLYNLILDKEFAEDTAGHKLPKTDTLRFTTTKQSNYGSVKINFSNIDLSRNPVLLFMIGGQMVKSFPLTSAVFFQPLFMPGDYELRMFNDENKNGKWDPGEFWKKRKQPEIVKSVGKKITIKANWDNEIEIAAPGPL